MKKKAITKNIAYLIVSLFLITTTIFLMLNFVLPFFYNTKQDNQEDVIEITCEIECDYKLVERGYIYPTLTATLKANEIPSRVVLDVDGKSYDVTLDDFSRTETETDYMLQVEKVVCPDYLIKGDNNVTLNVYFGDVVKSHSITLTSNYDLYRASAVSVDGGGYFDFMTNDSWWSEFM